jgi:NAD(P)-dependent dehydrogenase (short-subunit alcohol dehydrogenase family)
MLQITGCSSGIGKALAEHLAHQEYQGLPTYRFVIPTLFCDGASKLASRQFVK